MRFRRAVWAAVSAVVLATVAGDLAVAQSQAPTFRAGVTVVRLDVSVLDRRRVPIRGLVEQDFTVLVDGVQQKLVDVSEMDYRERAAAPSMPPAPAGFVSNQATPMRRAFAIILDDALTSGSPFMIEYSRKAAHAFVDGLQPDDVAAVVFTWNGLHNQDFTADRQRLHEAIDRFQSGPDDFEWSPSAIRGTTDLTIPAKLAMSRTLQDVTRLLNEAPHLRGAIVLVSPGMRGRLPGTSREDPLGLRTISEGEVVFGTELASAVGEAAYGRVPIYAFSNRGLVAPGSGANPWQPVSDARAGNGFLDVIATTSGGFAVVDTNEPDRGSARVLLENSHRYIIGYEASYPVQDGRNRRLEIRVRRGGATVHPSGRYIRTPAPAVREARLTPRSAIAGILPMTDVPVAGKVTVSGPEAAGSPVPVAVDLQVGPVEGATGDAHVECVAFDVSRLREVTSGTSRVTLAGTTLARVAMAIAPGRYNLRCGVHVPATGKLGSIYLPLEVEGVKSP